MGRSLGEFKKGKEEGEKIANSEVKEIVDSINADDVAKVEAPKTEEKTDA